MHLNRRAVIAGALTPLVPVPRAADHELFVLEVQLDVLRGRVVAQRRAGLEGAGWAKWNAAVAQSVALAERIGRTPAHDLSGFAIKLEALACAWEDDIEDHQIARLRALAREMAGRA